MLAAFKCTIALVLLALATTYAYFPVTPGAAWILRFGYNSAQFQEFLNTYDPQGYRLTWVSPYTVNNVVYYAAIWEKSSNSYAWYMRYGMSAAQYQQEFTARVNAGWRLVLVNGYQFGGVDYYAAIWDLAPSGPWIARHGMTPAQYQTEFNTQVANGYRLTHVSGYTRGAQQLYAAIWVKDNGPAFYARHGLTAAEYNAAFAYIVPQGYAPTLLDAWDTSVGTLFAGIWEQGAQYAWYQRYGMSASEFQLVFDVLNAVGYRPVQVTGYTNYGGSALYSCLWLKV